MAVRTATGISSIEQIPEQKAPLRISMAPRGETHPAGWATEKVFEEYGFSLDDVVSWGGSVTWESRVGDAGRTQLLQRGELDMVCDESIDSWRPFADTVDMTYLPIDADVQARLEQKYGMRPGVIAAGRLRGVKEDLPCLDFRGWLVFTRRDLPEEHAYLAVRAIDQTRSAMDDMFRERRGALHVGMTGHKVDMTQLCQHTEIPLHPGAERYYREKGYL